jgi:hypothetical protein
MIKQAPLLVLPLVFMLTIFSPVLWGQTTNSYDQLLSQSIAFLEEAQFANALVTAEQVIKMDGSRFEGFMIKALVLHNQGSNDQAKVFIEIAQQLSPADKKAKLQQIAQTIEASNSALPMTVQQSVTAENPPSTGSAVPQVVHASDSSAIPHKPISGGTNTVDRVEIESLYASLLSSDVNTVGHALKVLRKMDAPEAVPKILPLLKSANAHTIRDACRTLAVLGDKTIIPLIEPLLKDSRSDVADDAKKAIDKLRNKS